VCSSDLYYEKYKEEYGEEFLQNNWLKCYSSN